MMSRKTRGEFEVLQQESLDAIKPKTLLDLDIKVVSEKQTWEVINRNKT